MDLQLTGKIALITGGSRGLGRGAAKALAAEGCNLHLAARTESDLENARTEIVAAHGVAVTIQPTALRTRHAAPSQGNEPLGIGLRAH